MATADEDYFKDELTLKDVLLGVVHYIHTVWRYKWIVLLSMVLFLGLFLYLESQEPVKYKGNLTFMVNEEKPGGAGGFASILGQVGLGGNSSGEYNLEKIAELSKSQLIIHNVLLDSAVVNGEKDRLIHHIIDIYGLKKEWEDQGKSSWSEVRFLSDSTAGYNLIQRKVLKNIYGKVIGNRQEAGLVTVEFNPMTTILDMRGSTLNEELTAELVEKSFARLSDFYIDKSTATSQQTLLKLNTKVDSIRNVLSKAEYAIARRRDAGIGIVRRQDEVAVNQKNREVQILSVMYAEAIKNQATAEFTLNSSLPFFAVVDRPYLPLSAVKPQLRKQAIIGGVLGLILAIVIIVAVAIIRNVLSDN
ncbi:GumC domain-containing protein [Neolewinella persica]|uniref:hypothetical protein n=1 Tax=Neolewinella persica TaxID=70998 RepID=UPI00037FE735|nr:hypothetical protein [Neolewinella persica]